MPKLNSKLKPVSKTPKESVKLSVSAIESLFQADRQARFEVAKQYEEHWEHLRCFFHPVDNSLLGLGSVNDRLLTIALNTARKNAETIRYDIGQVLVFRSEAEDDSNGKYFVKIQGNLRYVGPTGDDE